MIRHRIPDLSNIFKLTLFEKNTRNLLLCSGRINFLFQGSKHVRNFTGDFETKSHRSRSIQIWNPFIQEVDIQPKLQCSNSNRASLTFSG